MFSTRTYANGGTFIANDGVLELEHPVFQGHCSGFSEPVNPENRATLFRVARASGLIFFSHGFSF